MYYKLYIYILGVCLIAHQVERLQVSGCCLSHPLADVLGDVHIEVNFLVIFTYQSCEVPACATCCAFPGLVVQPNHLASIDFFSMLTGSPSPENWTTRGFHETVRTSTKNLPRCWKFRML